MRARLRVALAIQSDPDILFLDEPGASLDDSGHELIHEITQAQLQRGAVVLATNDPNERRLATHELVLS
jgi:ABC-type multidrug transport system ATPase subunit